MARPNLRAGALSAIALAALISISCGASVDAVASLEPIDVVTGWYDDGIIAPGKNKLVPSVSFHLQNVSPEPIENVQINAVFRRLNEAESWGDRLIRGVGSDGLAAGATGKTLVVRNERGYTGSEPRAQMLKNSLFMDAKVDLFARHGSRTWVKIGEFPIERKLLTE